MKKIIIFLLLYSGITFAQNGGYTVKGVVVSTNNTGEQAPIPGVKLKWIQNTDMVLSGIDGHFEIKASALPDTLIVSFTGYKTLFFEITDPTINYTLNLKEGQLLNGVVVVGENLGKNIDLMNPMHVETIGTDELRKAACCNLSESFETNASVDVNITDAISGAKKIQLLGLDGVYTQLQWENIPLVRGLSTSYGLDFTPGTWIESIQITKGTGSVVNGYESMAGMINLELKKPNEAEKLYVNAYGNKFGRAEINLHGAQVRNKKWSTMTFLHGSNQFAQTDINKDGFRDMPMGYIGALMHRWNFDGKNSEAKFGVKATLANKQGGQLEANLLMPQIQNGMRVFKPNILSCLPKMDISLKIESLAALV